MDSFATHPTIWTSAGQNPLQTQSAVSEALAIVNRVGLRVGLTPRLRDALVNCGAAEALSAKRRDPELLEAGLLVDVLMGSLYELLASARVLEETCEFRVEAVDEALGAASPDIQHGFVEVMVVATDNDALSDVILGPAGVTECSASIADAACAATPIDDEAELWLRVCSSVDEWIACQPGEHADSEANVIAALGGRLPDVEWKIGPEFESSVVRLPDRRPGRIRQVFRACANAILREPSVLAAADDEPLDDVPRRRDGSEARRIRVQQKAPAALRLHYWHKPGHVELAKVGLHDEYDIPE